MPVTVGATSVGSLGHRWALPGGHEAVYFQLTRPDLRVLLGRWEERKEATVER